MQRVIRSAREILVSTRSLEIVLASAPPAAMVTPDLAPWPYPRTPQAALIQQSEMLPFGLTPPATATPPPEMAPSCPTPKEATIQPPDWALSRPTPTATTTLLLGTPPSVTTAPEAPIPPPG